MLLKGEFVASMGRDPALIKFGDKYLKLACVMENFAGGDGCYGNRKIFFDFWVEGEDKLPQVYSSYKARTIREYAGKLGKATDAATEIKYRILLNKARRKFVEKHDLLDLIVELEEIAQEINDPIRRQTRIDQANGLHALAGVVLYDIGLSNYCPPFPKIVESITGISPPMIPTRKELDELRGEISGLLSEKGYGGFPKGACHPITEGQRFANQVAAWRNGLGTLSEKKFVKVYKRSVQQLVEAMKRKIPGFPAEAEVRIIAPKKTGFDKYRSGSFDYGRGGPFKAENRITPDKGSTLLDVARVTAHEIGGHFMTSVNYHQYYLKTGDKFGATGTMCSNIAITDEGLAELGTKIYEEELTEIFDPEIMQNMVILQKLEELVMATGPFGINRAKHLDDITREEMKRELLGYGLKEKRVERRTEGIFNPLMMIKFLTYYGVTYWQGLKFIGSLVDKYGLEQVLEKCKEPISIVALSKSLEM